MKLILQLVKDIRDDAQYLDFFSSVGGMEMGEDGVAATQLGGEHPHGEHPSRTLFVRNINSNVEDSELRILFEVYLWTCYIPL